MRKFTENRWVLLLVLVTFIALKIPHLSYSYYWDESWPYATAIRALYNHGISLMPNAIDADISRGHPLFFHAIAALWMKVFGSSHVAMHSFALSISILLLIAVYEAGLQLFNKRVATITLVLIATQEVFFVQSSYVLFEVLVTLLCFVSMYFYVRGRYLLVTISLTMLFFTKESGLIMGFVLGIDALVSLFIKGIDRKTRLDRLISVGIPCVFFGFYLLLQKHLQGWYIYPFYANLVEHNWDAFWSKFRNGCVNNACCRNCKYCYFLLLATLAGAASARARKPQFFAIIVPVVFVFCFCGRQDAFTQGSILFFILFVAGWVWCTYAYCNERFFKHAAQRRFFVLASLFVLCFLIFSSMNFYTYRYILVAIIPLLFITAVLFDLFIAHTHRAFFYASLVAFALIPYFAVNENKSHHGDTDLASFDALSVHEATVDYFENNNYYDKHIASGPYLDVVHLTDINTGFLKKGKAFRYVKWTIDDSTDIIVMNNIENDYRYEQVKQSPQFKLMYRYEKGDVWQEIYQRK